MTFVRVVGTLLDDANVWVDAAESERSVRHGTRSAADPGLGVGIMVVTVIVVLSVLMAPAAHWVTYLLTGLAAACAFAATTAVLRRRRRDQSSNG
jgi:CHASE2 domain-containing sensor protein